MRTPSQPPPPPCVLILFPGLSAAIVHCRDLHRPPPTRMTAQGPLPCDPNKYLIQSEYIVIIISFELQEI